MFRSFITIAAVAGLVAGASAQQQMPAGSLHPVSNLQYGSFDFENGFTTTNNGNRVYGPDILFSTVAGFAYYWSTPGGGTLQEWVDEAQLPNRGLTKLEQVTGMSWSYCEGLGTSYFDATVRLYNDTTACVGPSSWTPGSHSFATCEYLVTGLPGAGCWQVGIDLSCGNECVLPDGTNPLSLTQGTIGWSVTAAPAGYYSGPILQRLADAPPGSQDLFEWQDRNGSFFGMGAYYNATCYWFGGNPHAYANFLVEFAGSPVDVQNCYPNVTGRPKDTLCLEALSNPTGGASLTFVVTDLAGAGAARATMMFEKDQAVTGIPGCEQASMASGKFTRQVGFPPLYAAPKPILVSSAPQGYTVPVLAAGTRCILQVVAWTGPSGYTIAQVKAVSNGLDVRL